MFKIQTVIKSIIRIAYLKTFPQALDNTAFIKLKPLVMCLPCPLVLKVVASFYDKIEIITFNLLCYPLD